MSLLDLDDGDGDQSVGFAVGVDDGGGVGRLGEAEHGAVLFIHPIVDKIYSVFLLNGEVFLMGGGDGGRGDIAGSEFMDVEVEVVIPFDHGFLAVAYLVDIVGQEAVGFGVG